MMNKMAKNNTLFIFLVAGIAVLSGLIYLLKTNSLNSAKVLPTEPVTQRVESSDNKNNWQNREDNPSSCSSTPAVFDNPFTNISDISKITPGSGTGDARFTYLWIKSGKSVPIFAPANGKLTKITYKVRTDLPSSMSKPDYDLAFEADCHTTFVINHITDPRADIAATKPVTEPIQLKPGSGINDNDTIPSKAIEVKAGEQIGTTTGTPAAHNFDFGVFTDDEAVCPYDKFSEPLHSSWLKLFNGTACQVSGHR